MEIPGPAPVTWGLSPALWFLTQGNQGSNSENALAQVTQLMSQSKVAHSLISTTCSSVSVNSAKLPNGSSLDHQPIREDSDMLPALDFLALLMHSKVSSPFSEPVFLCAALAVPVLNL